MDSPEIDCNCDNRIHVEWNQDGEVVRCVDCGQLFISTNDGLQAMT